MPHWSEKTLRYHCGVLIQLAGFCVYIVGFGSPAWSQTYSLFERDSISGYYGLWQICGKSISTCVSHEYLMTGVPSWLTAARALCCIGLLISIMSLIVLFLYNFTKMSRAITEEMRAVRVLPTFAGVLGVLGASTYAIRTQIMMSPDNVRLSWGFGITVTGSVCVTLSACLLTVKPSSQRQNQGSGMQTWSTGVAMADASAGFGYWEGPPGGPAVNPAFQDAVVTKPPEYADAPPSYDEVMRGNS